MKKIYKRILVIVMTLLLGVSFGFPVYATESNSVRLMIESYEVIDGVVAAGENFSLNIKLKNVSDIYVARNAMMSVVNNQGIVFPEENISNQIFIGEIEPGKTKEVTLKLRLTEEISVKENILLYFEISFIDETMCVVKSEANIAVPLMDLYLLSIEDMEISDNCSVNQNAVLSSKIVNEGNEDVYNAELHVKSSVGESFVYKLGDVKHNVSNLYDSGIKLSSAGEQVLSAYVTYEDEEKNQYQSEIYESNVRVLETEEKMIGEAEENKNLDFIQQMLDIVFAIVAVVIILVYQSKTSKKIVSGKETSHGK